MDETLPIELSHRYHLRGKLGEGGMGEVYLAHDTVLDRQVAIKLVHHQRLDDSDARRLFRREARATAQLEHPGIVRIYDFLPQEHHDYIVMEHLRGETLEERLKGSPLGSERALQLFHDVATGLAHAHEKGIVHRDLKPGNIWITPDEQVKLLDFGLAKQVETDESSIFQGQIVGTVRYMSPEQARGKDLDQRSDLFSLGVVLYQALTGELPFAGETQMESLANTITEQHIPAVERNPEVPQGISDLIDRLLAKDPQKRLQSATEVAEALKNVDADTGFTWSKKAGLGAIAVVTALVLIIIAFLTWEDPPRPSVAVLGVAGGPEEIAWTATAVVEILNAHLQAGDELRIVDGYHTALVRPPENPGEKLAEDELAHLGEQLRVDHLVVGKTVLDGALLRVQLGLYQAGEGKRVAEISAEGKPLELADFLVDAAAWLRRELGLEPLGPEVLDTARAAFPPGDAGREYAKGLSALRDYDPRTAREHLEEVMQGSSQHPMPAAALVRAQVELGNVELAIEAAHTALDLAGNLPNRQQLDLAAMAAEASQDWSEAVRLRRVLWRERPDEFTPGLDLVEALLAVGEVDEAQELIAELTPISLTLVDDGYLDFARSRAAILLGDFRAACDAARRAVEVSEVSGARQLGAAARFYESVTLNRLGAREAAREALAESRRCFARVDNLTGLFGYFSEHVLTLAGQGRIAEAQEEFAAYRDDIYHDGDRYYEALMAANLGTLLIEQGDLDGATDLLDESSAIFEALGMSTETAVIVLNLGVAEQLHGRLESARQHYEEARDRFEDLGDRANLAYALTNLGELLFWAGDFDGALAFHRRALKINRELGLPSGVAWDTFRIAETLRRQGELDAALEHYKEAIAEQEALGEAAAGETRIGLARLELARDNRTNALNHARDAARELRAAGMVDLAVLAQLAEVEVLLAQTPPDLSEARELLGVVQLHVRTTDDRRLQLTTRLLAARLAAMEGRVESAAENLERLVADASADGFLVIAEDARKLQAAVIEMSPDSLSTRPSQ